MDTMIISTDMNGPNVSIMHKLSLQAMPQTLNRTDEKVLSNRSTQQTTQLHV